ncbi:Hypothetical protein PACV_67 [Pacmanvirus A23]|nr:Hypothetical protein B9W72_gp067 [Pacmanvirus A23]SIP85784.1 Hypothetical protein PACV_67 [Pacmanvirus A23]
MGLVNSVPTQTKQPDNKIEDLSISYAEYTIIINKLNSLDIIPTIDE